MFNFLITPHLPKYLDFEFSQQLVLKFWYENRIQEETVRNIKLRELHESITILKRQHDEQKIIELSN